MTQKAVKVNNQIQQEFNFFDPSEPRQIPGWGWWTLNKKVGTQLTQKSYRLNQLEYVLTHINKSCDTYMSQAFFTEPNRRALNLAYITHAYVDLDIYNILTLRAKSAENIAHELLLFCQDNFIPAPSYIVSSGRGLYMKWAFDRPVPKQAAGIAVAVNKALVRKFESFGADPKAVDMSRILRVVGSVNTKNGEIVKILYLNGSSDNIKTYKFNDFADTVLPLTYEEIKENRQKNIEKNNLSILAHERKKHDITAKKQQNKKFFCWDDWHWKITVDLEKLVELRYQGDMVPEGMRDLFGFIGSVQLAHIFGNNSGNLWFECLAWSRKILPFSYANGELQRNCSTLLDRAKRASRGEKVEYRGKQVSPIYTYRKSTLIDLFEITDDEMKSMSALISDDVKRVRDTEATRLARREQGTQERSEWLAEHSVEASKPWEAEGISRATWYRRQQK